MSQPLLWMPVLDGRGMSGPFLVWAADRFLRSHGGIGHIIADQVGAWRSFETTKPVSAARWYLADDRTVPKKVKCQTITVEMPVPAGAGDRALDRLERAQAAGPVGRLVLVRPRDLSLDRAATSIRTLGDTVSSPLWLDLKTFGWVAASYLLARDPALQVAGVEDDDLWRLLNLAEILHRPLVMRDLSGGPDRPVPSLPRFYDEKGATRVLKALPIWARSR